MAKGYIGVNTFLYTPLDYIESTGTQYIDTGVVRDITKKFRFVSSVKWNDVQTRQCIGAQGHVYFGVSGGKYQITQGGTTTTDITATTSSFSDIDLTFDCPNNICTGSVDSVPIRAISATYADSPQNAHIHLFSLNDLVLPCSVKIASFKIYQDDVLVRDFIPVIDQDNVACMYELVEGKFYYNKGSGTFAAGSTTGQPVLLSKARKIKKAYVGIPASYTPIEYIESTGTQYIDTGTTFDRNTKVEMEFKILGNDNQFLLGARDSSSTNQLYMIYYASDNFRVTMYNSNNVLVTYPTINNKDAKIVFDTSTITLTINGTDYNYTSSVGSESDTNLPMYLFTCNTNSTTSLLAKMRLYSCKFYKNGTLVRDFKPALDENNVVCLYDSANGGFYYNNGTGNFLPSTYDTDEYEVLDYIESSEAQYIDTGFKPNQDTKIELDIQSTSNSTSNVFAGGRQAFQNNAYYISQQYGDGSNIGYRFAYGTQTYDVPNTYQDVNRHLFVLNKNLAYIDNNIVKTFNTQTFTAPVPLWLFAGNNNGSVIQPAKIKLYSCKIWNNSTIVRAFVPVKRKSDDEICLYDLITKQFYTNQGTGTFIAGSHTGQPMPTPIQVGGIARTIKKGYIGVTETYTPLNYISSNELQRIDTGVKPYQTKTEIKFALNSVSYAEHDYSGGGNNETIGGVWNPDNNRYYVCYAIKTGSSSTSQFESYNRDGTAIVLGSLDTNAHVLVYNDENNKVIFDNVEKGTVSDLTTPADRTLPLFCVSWETQITNYASIKFYYCKIWDKTTNTLIRDFIPAKTSNGVACLYDRVEGKAYFNQGGDKFTASAASGDPDITAPTPAARKAFRAPWTWADIEEYTKFVAIVGNDTYIKTGAQRLRDNMEAIKSAMISKGADYRNYNNFMLSYRGNNDGRIYITMWNYNSNGWITVENNGGHDINRISAGGFTGKRFVAYFSNISGTAQVSDTTSFYTTGDYYYLYWGLQTLPVSNYYKVWLENRYPD